MFYFSIMRAKEQSTSNLKQQHFIDSPYLCSGKLKLSYYGKSKYRNISRNLRSSH